jgi:transposase
LSVGFTVEHLTRQRHPSYAATTCYRLGTFTLWAHGFLQASHNASDRALRVVALGRKNFLFVGDVEAGDHLATLYSLVSTCEARDIDLVEYRKDGLMRVDTHPASHIDELLPHKWSPPLRSTDTS